MFRKNNENNKMIPELSQRSGPAFDKGEEPRVKKCFVGEDVLFFAPGPRFFDHQISRAGINQLRDFTFRFK